MISRRTFLHSSQGPWHTTQIMPPQQAPRKVAVYAKSDRRQHYDLEYRRRRADQARQRHAAGRRSIRRGRNAARRYMYVATSSSAPATDPRTEHHDTALESTPRPAR